MAVRLAPSLTTTFMANPAVTHRATSVTSQSPQFTDFALAQTPVIAFISPKIKFHGEFPRQNAAKLPTLISARWVMLAIPDEFRHMPLDHCLRGECESHSLQPSAPKRDPQHKTKSKIL